MNFVDLKEIIFDTNLILAVIAINMTVIGLTSLAETKKIIGVDYGRFLVKKYRLFGRVRIYEMLIVFAIINISSLFFMFVQTLPFRMVHFLFLIISLVFAIYYFFSYIISENKQVKKQIYEDELLGLYYDSEDFNHQEADLVTRMSGGSRTSKKLSSNVISYFDTYNSDSQSAFAEVFGEHSIIYDYSKKARKKVKKRYGLRPYQYRKRLNGIYDISYEYFQLFRASEQQFKWTLEILRIFDGDRQRYPKFDLLRLYNFSRIVTHLNLFGNNESIYRYKFLEYLSVFYYQAVAISNEEKIQLENSDHIWEVEKYTYLQFLYFMFDNSGGQRDSYFIQKASKIAEELILSDKYKGILPVEDRIMLLLDKALDLKSETLQSLFTSILNAYYEQTDQRILMSGLQLNSIKRYIEFYKETNIHDDRVTPEELFKA